MGPDVTNWYLGRWCKHKQSKGSVVMQGTSANSGDLIAAESDGRGGRVKVLRSMNQSSLDAKGNSLSAKKCKYEAKTSSLQSQGSLQVEHFFGGPVSNQRYMWLILSSKLNVGGHLLEQIEYCILFEIPG
uniref:Uncharacterized protein n=1 Tax=Populus trichocarpa TaxID=3694 RepID=A0A3N7EJ67_POPTR